MSNPRSFRFSEEVEELLERQGDTKAVKGYIEGLILGKPGVKTTTGTPHELTEGRVSYLLTQQTQEIIDHLKNNRLATPKVTDQQLADNANQMYGAVAKNMEDLAELATRSKSEVRAEIDQLEAERKSELEFLQDQESITHIHANYQKTIDGLWKEYHSL